MVQTSSPEMREKLVLLLPKEEIAKAVCRLAEDIRTDYQGKSPLLVGVLKGAFMFLADLVRQIPPPLSVDFIRASSYGASTETSGKVKVVHALDSPVKGRDVLLVEDIVDTGLTTRFLLDYLSRKKPASLKLCALLDKRERRSRLAGPVQIDYLGFTVPNRFVVGYGIDVDQRYRNLPDIYYVLKE